MKRPSVFSPRLPLLRLLCAIGVVLGVTLPLHFAAAQDLRPFTARYQAYYRGMSGGTLTLSLRKGALPNEYIYESRAKPSFLASFLVSEAARETSSMLVEARGVRPLKFLSDDGKKGDAKDSNLQFDWEHKRLTGRTETTDMNREIPDRLQDHLSVQVAVIWALQHGAELGEFPLVDGGEIKFYNYAKEGGAKLDFKGRQIETEIVRSARANSNGGRITKYWHAAELGSIPLQAERSRDGKVDLTMKLIDVQFSD